MDVHRGDPGRPQQPSGKDLSVCDHDDEVGIQSVEKRAVLFRADSLRLMDRQILLQSKLFYGRGVRLLSAAGRPIGLGEDGGDFIFAGD